MTSPPVARERPSAKARLPLTAAELAGWDAILDARSPAEFAEDHLPGAVSCPVLDDAERALVGTVYKERGSFEAKRLGAPLAAANIARVIAGRFADRPRNWRPLVYCWRGGSRSGSLTHVLRQVGWDAVQLEGGYKAFRRQVAAELETMPARFRFRVVCGATGSGKSRLLEALSATDAQVLDLEVLAAHRGSVLGELPGAPQPTQKAFETAIWSALSAFDPARAVFVESESRKVGNLRVPDALIARMREGSCLRLEADTGVRVDLLLEDYAHLVAAPAVLRE
jgi:tRNA 2-selenouridine synthase